MLNTLLKRAWLSLLVLILLLPACGRSEAVSKATQVFPLDPCQFERATTTMVYHGRVDELTFNPPYGRGRCTGVVVEISNLPVLGGVDVRVMATSGAMQHFIVYGRQLGGFDWVEIGRYPAGGSGPVFNRFVRIHGNSFAVGRVVAAAELNGHLSPVTIRIAPAGLVGG